MRQAPEFERMLVRSGIRLYKYWFSVTRDEQLRRFKSRELDPLKRWKLSPIDLASLDKWDDYTEAKEAMFFYTDTADAPWTIVKSNDKKRARLNAMKHFLSTLDYPDKDPDDRHAARSADRRQRKPCNPSLRPYPGRRLCIPISAGTDRAGQAPGRAASGIAGAIVLSPRRIASGSARQVRRSRRCFVATLLTDPAKAGLEAGMVDALRNAWGGGDARWLNPGIAAEFDLHSMPGTTAGRSGPIFRRRASTWRSSPSTVGRNGCCSPTWTAR
jgi:hypothetical protein